jgi:hypothetical protein
VCEQTASDMIEDQSGQVQQDKRLVAIGKVMLPIQTQTPGLLMTNDKHGWQAGAGRVQGGGGGRAPPPHTPRYGTTRSASCLLPPSQLPSQR